MPDDKRLIADFNAGRHAAQADRPRAACNLRPSQAERYDAWMAGYEYESAGDGPFVVNRLEDTVTA